jgi:hypothetical protein
MSLTVAVSWRIFYPPVHALRGQSDLRISCVALILMALTTWQLHAGESTHDISETRLVRYKVSKSGEGLKISGKGQATRVFLSERSTYQPDEWISESFKARIDKIKATFRGERLKSSQITAVYRSVGDVFFEENRSWHIDLPTDVKPGDSLWLEYRINYGDVIWYPKVMIPNEDRITRYELRYEHPKEVRIEFDLIFPRDSLRYRVVRPSEKETALIFDTIPYARSHAYYAHNNWRAAIVAKFYRDSVLLNPVTVPKLSEWYGNLVGWEPRLEPDTDSVLSKNLSLASGDTQKLQVIHDHVRRNIRDISTGERHHQVAPNQPGVVLSRRYGDCKDRAFLVQALAASQDIDVDLCLVYSQPPVGYDGTNFTFINHVICVHDTGDSLIFMDPTAKYTPFGSMPEGLLGREVVIVDSLQPRKVRVPVPRAEPMVTIQIEATLENPEAATAEIVLTGVYLSHAIGVLEENTHQAFEETLGEMITAQLYKIDLKSFAVTARDSTSLTLTASADLSDLIIKSPRRTYVPHLAFNFFDSDILKRSEDSLPLHFYRRSGVRLTIDLIGADLSVEPDRVSLGDDVIARFEASAEQLADDTVRLRYAYDRHYKILSGDQKISYLEFYRACLGEKQRVFNLEVKGDTE